MAKSISWCFLIVLLGVNLDVLTNWLLKGPQSSGEIIFHELGHAHLFTKFRGEVEAVVNLPYVAVLNRGFDVDLDTAFGRSFSKPTVSLDQAAIMWMVSSECWTMARLTPAVVAGTPQPWDVIIACIRRRPRSSVRTIHAHLPRMMSVAV